MHSHMMHVYLPAKIERCGNRRSRNLTSVLVCIKCLWSVESVEHASIPMCENAKAIFAIW